MGEDPVRFSPMAMMMAVTMMNSLYIRMAVKRFILKGRPKSNSKCLSHISRSSNTLFHKLIILIK